MRNSLAVPLGYFATPLHQDVHFIRAEVTAYQRELVTLRCNLPNFAVYDNPANPAEQMISGPAWFVRHQFGDAILAKRFRLLSSIEVAVRSATPREFEVLVSKLIAAIHGEGLATKSSRDKGRDVLGRHTKSLAFTMPSLRTSLGYGAVPDWSLTASCKHQTGGGGAAKTAIQPAFIRELVGTWAIERWTQNSIQSRYLASPVRAVLATTYRLSTDSWELCSKCGIEVFSLPDVLLFTCKYAPDPVVVSDRVFSLSAFKKWVAG